LILDKTLPPPIGRIRLRIGSKDKEFLAEVRKAVQWAYENGRWEELKRLKEKKIHPALIVKMRSTNAEILDNEDFALREQNLWSSLGKFLHTNHYADRTLSVYAAVVNRMQRHHGKDRNVNEIARVLEREKQRMDKEGIRNGFASVRFLFMAFLRDNCANGRDSSLYKEVLAIKNFPKAKTPPKTNKNPFHPLDLDRFLRTDTQLGDGFKAWIYWLCCHGLGPKEFLEDGFAVHADRGFSYLQVFGQKRSTRNRILPLVMTPPDSPKPSFYQMRYALKRADRSPYDLRRTYVQICLAAGIARTHIQTYVGHTIGLDVLSLYERQDIIKNWLRPDTNRIQAYLKTSIDLASDNDQALIRPFANWESIGSLQDWKIADIKSELNKILLFWHEKKGIRKLYQVEHLVDLSKDPDTD